MQSQEARVELGRIRFRRAVALPACERWVPLDYWQHARNRDDPFRVLLGVADGRVYLAVFNWSEQSATIGLDRFPSGTTGRARLLHGEAGLTVESAALTVSLAGHSSAVLVFDETYSPLHAEGHVQRALPHIERLLLALPPVDPDAGGARGAKVIRLTRK